MKRILLLVGLFAYVSVSFSQFSPKEQIVFSRFTAPEWQQIIKESKSNTQQFENQMLEYAKNNIPLIKIPNNGNSKKDSVEFFQTSQLWVAYNPYLPPYVPYSHKTTFENPEEDLALYLTGLKIWKEYNKEKWSEIDHAINAETNADYPKLKITENKLQSYKQYEEQLIQWQKQNPWYAKVLMKAHLEQIKRQLGL